MLAALTDIIVKATLLLLLAGGITLLLARSAAALRHLVWALAFAGLLALPAATALLPAWRVALWPRFRSPVAFDVATLPVASDAPTAVGVPAAAAPAMTAVAPPVGAPPSGGVAVTAAPQHYQISFAWTALLLPVWIGGTLLIFAGVIVGLGRIEWLARTSAPLRDAGWRRLVAALARDLGLDRPVRLLQSRGPAMPMTWGVRRPVILLPAAADEWPVDRRRDVLLHELAHVKRYDFLTQLVARAVCAVYWFHPLVWFGAARMRIERERACDDQVLRSGTRPSDYAALLLDIARSLRPAGATSLATVAMARPAQLAGRLLDVLDANRRREVVGLHVAVPAWLAAAGIMLPLAAASPSAERGAPARAAGEEVRLLPPGFAPLTGLAGAWSVAGAAGKGKPARGDAAASTDSLSGCRENGRRAGISTHSVDDGMMINTTIGPCSVHLTAEGRFTFSEDFTDIGTVSRGGEVVVEVDYGDHERRLVVTPDGADLKRVYTVDRAARPFDADARAWLAETLTFLLRRSGVAAEERAQWLLRTRGINGLIEEIAQLHGDYARRLYYQAAIESGKLDAAGYERLVTRAGQEIESDYELAELLIAVAAVQPLTEQMQAGFIAAARTIDSDYERRRVLDAALSRPGLSAAGEAAVLAAAAGMDSDYELAELLLKLNHARPIGDAVRPAFFQAVNSIQSDYEHRRVLAAIVPAQGMSPAMLGSTLESAKTIGSDYELAELLTEVAGSYVIDDALRPAFFSAVNTIESDYEHARALKSLLERQQVDKPVVQALLESAKGINSSYELAELLIAAARRVRIDETLRPAYLEAARRLSSGYERDRALAALARSSGRAELE